MMKFFRKYNKQLLAVFMVLLMIVFIGGTALEGLLMPAMDSPVGSSRFGEITDLDLQRKKMEVTNILELTGRNWNQMFGVGEPIELVDWYLLTKESESLGLSAEVAEVKAMSATQEADDAVNLVAQRLRVRPDAIHRAIAEYRSVQNSAMAIGAASYPSEAEIQKLARDALEKVEMKAVVIPAAVLVEHQPEPTEEELRAHLEKYKDKQPGPGLNFGYYRPPSAKIEYVKIDRDAITETIGVANLERKAKAHYEKNRETHLPFKRHAGNNPEPPPTPEGQEPDPKAAEFLTWDEAKHIAIGAVKKEHAAKAASELAQWIIDADAENWLDLPRKESGYKEAPAAVKSPTYFAELLKRVPPTMSHPNAVSVATTDWFTSVEARDLPELGAARHRLDGGLGVSVADLVARSEAFVPEIPKTAGVSELDFIPLYQAAHSPLHDTNTGNFFVIRVIERAPARPAESVDEVREQLVTDVKLLKAFEDAKQRAAALAQCSGTLKDAFAGNHELSAIANEDSDPPGGYYEPTPFSRVPFALAGLGQSKEGIYVGKGVGRLPSEIIEQIFTLGETSAGPTVIDIPIRAAVMVVEVGGLIRAQEDEFNALKAQLGEQLASARWQRAVTNWLNSEHIRARNGFKVTPPS